MAARRGWRSRWGACGVLAVVATAAAGLGGRLGAGAQTGLQAGAQMNAPLDTAALVRRAVDLRLQEEKHHRPVEYVLRKRDGDHETTKEIVETADGDVARLIAINGLPLDADQQQAEIDRLDKLEDHPELQWKRHKAEQKDAARIDALVGLLPESEVYTMEGTAACGTGQCYRLSFAPNPAFVPPNLEAEVLEGFAGEVWIDKTEGRLVRLDAHLVREVNIGFGILGRLDKGGTMVLEQAYESDVREWQPTVLKMNLTGRALMVKTVDIQIDVLASGFQPVPEEMGYREGIAMLKRAGMPGAQR